MPVAVRDLLDLGLIVPFEEGGILLVEFVENPITARNAGYRLAGPGDARKRDHPRDAKHSREKQPTFHRKPPELLTIDRSLPGLKTGSSENAD